MQAIYFSDIREDFIGHICAEIFRDGVYEPYLANKRDLVILDVGAHVGLFSLYASKYAKIIYAIEPSNEHFQNLVAMVKFNRLENVKPLKLAIFNEDKQFQLFHNKNKTMFSLHQSVNDGSSLPEMVDCVRLDTLFKKLKLKKVDFMKLDVEGSEAEIFGGDGFAKVAKKIDTIVFEYHQWCGRHPHQVKFSLEQRGFEVSPIKADATLWVAKRKK